MRAKPVASGVRFFVHLACLIAALVVVVATLVPASAEDSVGDLVLPVPLTDAVAQKRADYAAAAQPELTPELLQAYVDRQRQLQAFDAFDVPEASPQLTQDMLLGYISRRQNQALDAIESVDLGQDAGLTPDMVASYAEKDFVPTAKRVKLADGERLCLAQAIYHEARGESVEGQLAVANVIINRAMSKRYPSTICGVVYQNADKGKFRCQFTFACDGKSDNGTERTAWNRSLKLADQAFREFQYGDRPGVIPDSVLFYHTTAVAPSWSNKFHRVASIGAHVFYSTN